MKLGTSKRFIEFIEKRIESFDFESWLYESSYLEEELGSELYIEIVSINFKNKSARAEFAKIIDSHIDYSLLHTHLLKSLIDKILSGAMDLLEGLGELYYKWLGKGYDFLAEIDIIGNFGEQGKSIVHIMDKTMTNQEKWNTLDRSNPNFKSELKNIGNKIQNGQIILNGESEMNKFLGRQFKYEIK